MSFVCTRMSHVCKFYVTRMYGHVIRMSLVYARILSKCTRMPFVCQSYALVYDLYVTIMYLRVMVCHSHLLVHHPYVSLVYSCMSFVCHLLCFRTSFVYHSYVLVCHTYVSNCFHKKECTVLRAVKHTVVVNYAKRKWKLKQSSIQTETFESFVLY